MSDENDNAFEKLRRDYERLPKHEPGAAIDATVRAAARRHTPQRRLRVWSGALASAACIGLAVVLVPALLVEAPAPAMRPAKEEPTVKTVSEEAARDVAVQRAERKARERTAAPMMAPPLAAFMDADSQELVALRAELANADEAVWRERLLELRATGHETLALALLGDFRKRFGRPASFTLDDLAAEKPRD